MTTNIEHVLDRLLLVQLMRRYTNKHGIEYSPNMQAAFQRVAQHIQKHTDTDARLLCSTCEKKCTGDACRLS